LSSQSGERRPVGYLIPEFPGQTHIFFWREMGALRTAGIEPELVSTRLPSRSIISHDWAEEAMRLTEYLFPLKPKALGSTIVELVRGGPKAWARCALAIGTGQGSIKDKLRRAPLVLFGAELAAVARREGWTHVHVHSCANAASVAMFAHFLSGMTYSITLHGPLEDYGPDQPQKWANAAFAIVITQRLLEEVGTELAGALPPIIKVAPMGVDVEKFKRTTPYVPWRGEGPFQVFSCGRLNPCKGHDDLIKAIGLVRKEGIDARLAIAGEDDSGTGQYRAYLEKLIADEGLKEHVTLLGAVSEQVVRKGIETAHAFGLASLHEPLGVAIMEAMAMSTPVVVAKGGGVTELVSDGEDGLLATPQEPATVAAKLVQLARDPALASRLVEAGRRKVTKSFHQHMSAEALVAALRDIGSK
jgi:colanic acid/amylovoran biosynthesis glycosyltransferase